MKQLTIQGFTEPHPILTKNKLETFFNDMATEEVMQNDVSHKEIRLLQDLAKQHAPLDFDRNDVIRSLVGFDIPDERIAKVKSFKQIVKKKVIVYKDDRFQTISVIRKRKK